MAAAGSQVCGSQQTIQAMHAPVARRSEQGLEGSRNTSTPAQVDVHGKMVGAHMSIELACLCLKIFGFCNVFSGVHVWNISQYTYVHEHTHTHKHTQGDDIQK
jgi:hypothetical protein